MSEAIYAQETYYRKEKVELGISSDSERSTYKVHY